MSLDHFVKLLVVFLKSLVLLENLGRNLFLALLVYVYLIITFLGIVLTGLACTTASGLDSEILVRRAFRHHIEHGWFFKNINQAFNVRSCTPLIVFV